MINFEEKISKSVRVKTKNLDTSAFILNLKNRHNKELKRIQRFKSGFAAFAFIFIISLVTILQLDNYDLIHNDLKFTDYNDAFYDEYIFSDYNENEFDENEFTFFMYEESFHYDVEELVYLNEFFIKHIDEEKSL
tara:strand:- start:143 stop:547 length:405 start_codon:yes stop_codon:yes gene_type:complete